MRDQGPKANSGYVVSDQTRHDMLTDLIVDRYDPSDYPSCPRIVESNPVLRGKDLDPFDRCSKPV